VAESGAPAPFLARWLPELLSEAPALDLACGRGRNALALGRAGIPTVALDRSPDALRILTSAASHERLPIFPVQADLEADASPPFPPGRFGAVVVFRYLHRPLVGAIARLLRPGGWLVYETFTTAQRELEGGPRSEAFLLRPGELPELFPSLRILHFEEGVFSQPSPQATARIVARAPA
jgi:tellurite methyltransferase